jgi:hypothetical protein
MRDKPAKERSVFEKLNFNHQEKLLMLKLDSVITFVIMIARWVYRFSDVD